MREEHFISAVPVTRGPKHHFFGYYDKFQVDASGRYLLGMEVGFMDRRPEPDDMAVIGLIDLENGYGWTPLVETSAWCWQQGCMLQWLPSEPNRKIIFNVREGDHFVCAIQDIETGERRTLSRAVHTVGPDGRTALCNDFERVQHTRPGYGYAGIKDPGFDEPHPDYEGAYLMDLDTGGNHLIISLDRLAHFEPDDTMQGGKHWVNHLQYSVDGKRFMFLHRWQHPDNPKRWHTRMFTANPDGSELYLLNPDDMTSHYDWQDDRRILAWARRYDLGDHYYLFTDKTQDVKVIGEPVLTVDGHCSFSPDRKWILTDTYPDKEESKRRLILYNVDEGRRIDIGRFYAPPEISGEIRCDLHPRWSRDGRLVTIDSAHEGTRQIYMLDVSEIVG